VEHHSAVDKIILVLMVKEKGKDIRMRMAMEELLQKNLKGSSRLIRMTMMTRCGRKS